MLGFSASEKTGVEAGHFLRYPASHGTGAEDRALKGAACRHVYLIQGQNSNKGTVQITEKLTSHMEHGVVGFQPFKGVEIWQVQFSFTCLFFFFLSVSTKPICN